MIFRSGQQTLVGLRCIRGLPEQIYRHKEEIQMQKRETEAEKIYRLTEESRTQRRITHAEKHYSGKG